MGNINWHVVLGIVVFGIYLAISVKKIEQGNWRKKEWLELGGSFVFVMVWILNKELYPLSFIFLAVMVIVYSYLYPNNPQPSQRPKMPAKHVKLWVRVLFIIITIGGLWGLIRWLYW